jgi:hypothetical protein
MNRNIDIKSTTLKTTVKSLCPDNACMNIYQFQIYWIIHFVRELLTNYFTTSIPL